MLLSITCCMQALPTFFANLVGDPYLTIGITIPSILVFVQSALSLPACIAFLNPLLELYPKPRVSVGPFRSVTLCPGTLLPLLPLR